MDVGEQTRPRPEVDQKIWVQTKKEEEEKEVSLVTYVDVNSILVRGKIKQGNYKEVLVVEVADTEDEKVVLVFNGSMASAMKQEMIRHVEEELPEEANIDDRPQAAIDSENICIG